MFDVGPLEADLATAQTRPEALLGGRHDHGRDDHSDRGGVFGGAALPPWFRDGR